MSQAVDEVVSAAQASGTAAHLPRSGPGLVQVWAQRRPAQLFHVTLRTQRGKVYLLELNELKGPNYNSISVKGAKVSIFKGIL